MKKLIVMFLCLVMCGVLVGCSVDKKTTDDGNNNSSQEQSYKEKDDNKENTNKNQESNSDSKFYSAQFSSINNDELEVILQEEVDSNYDFSDAGVVTDAMVVNPNEKEEDQDSGSPFTIFKITKDVKLENSNGGNLDLKSLFIGSTLLIEVKDNKLIRVVEK